MGSPARHARESHSPPRNGSRRKENCHRLSDGLLGSIAEDARRQGSNCDDASRVLPMIASSQDSTIAARCPARFLNWCSSEFNGFRCTALPNKGRPVVCPFPVSRPQGGSRELVLWFCHERHLPFAVRAMEPGKLWQRTSVRITPRLGECVLARTSAVDRVVNIAVKAVDCIVVAYKSLKE